MDWADGTIAIDWHVYCVGHGLSAVSVSVA